jgi:hypothetical protein
MKIQHTSAVTLGVQDMAQSVNFYRKLGLEPLYCGEHANLTTFRASEDYINLCLVSSQAGRRLNRVILRVDEVDLLHSKLKEIGLEPESPGDGARGERFF